MKTKMTHDPLTGKYEFALDNLVLKAEVDQYSERERRMNLFDSSGKVGSIYACQSLFVCENPRIITTGYIEIDEHSVGEYTNFDGEFEVTPVHGALKQPHDIEQIHPVDYFFRKYRMAILRRATKSTMEAGIHLVNVLQKSGRL